MVADNALPYGLRDVKLTPISDAGVLGTPVDLPASRTFSFSEAEEFEELRGDDQVVAIRGRGPSVEWELESGGISLPAYAVMAGGTVADTGVTPETVRSFKKKTTDARPYFKVEGQAISDSGGDFHAIVYKCRANDTLEGELSDGTFWLTSASGQGIGNDDDDLYEFIQNETATPIDVGP
jgi:hypothetical protein